MDINEVLQGLSNLGGEMPRVTKPKRIKEIKPGKKNSNVRKRRGPMNIDLSKLGEEVEAMRDLVERAKQVKAKSKMPKKMKPNAGHESPHPYQGSLVGEAEDTGMYNNDELVRNAKAAQASRRQSARTNEFNWQDFYEFVFKTYPTKNGEQIMAQRDTLMMKYQNHMNAQNVKSQLSKDKPDYKELDVPAYKRAGMPDPVGKPKESFKSLEESVGEFITEEEFDRLAEKKDACYHKVKSRYKVWPSAYASGALVQCRKKGAKNWGNKSKKK